jgi:hypothetical protein
MWATQDTSPKMNMARTTKRKTEKKVIENKIQLHIIQEQWRLIDDFTGDQEYISSCSKMLNVWPWTLMIEEAHPVEQELPLQQLYYFSQQFR